TGADDVVSWQTGFPFGVNMSRGYPRFSPGEFTTVDVLSRGEADAALIVAADPGSNFPQAAIDHLRRIPVIVLDPKETHTSRLANGRVYDPANGVDGEVRDVCIADGRIVADVAPEAGRIDARGMAVMLGGVDMHCHIAGSKVNLARKLQPEDHRDDVLARTAVTRSGVGG